jgi:sugar phosphate isomerase/epimerase
MKLGAKLNLSDEKRELLESASKIFDFIEVYYLPFNPFTLDVSQIKTRWVVHGPHGAHGVNLGSVNSKIESVKDSILLANKIGAKKLIVHPAEYKEKLDKKRMMGNLKELNENCEWHSIRMLIENLPLLSDYEIYCFGAIPEEIKEIVRKVKCGFVLDFSHAYHASVSLKKDYKDFILEFMKLKPEHFHLYDSRANLEMDVHLPLGEGELDIPFFLSLIKDEDVTLELDPQTYSVYVNALNYLRKVEK